MYPPDLPILVQASYSRKVQNILECTCFLDLHILENCKRYTWKSAKMLQKVLEYTGFSMTKMGGHPESLPLYPPEPICYSKFAFNICWNFINLKGCSQKILWFPSFQPSKSGLVGRAKKFSVWIFFKKRGNMSLYWCFHLVRNKKIRLNIGKKWNWQVLNLFFLAS